MDVYRAKYNNVIMKRKEKKKQWGDEIENNLGR